MNKECKSSSCHSIKPSVVAVQCGKVVAVQYILPLLSVEPNIFALSTYFLTNSRTERVALARHSNPHWIWIHGAGKPASCRFTLLLFPLNKIIYFCLMSELGSNKLRNTSPCSALCRQESLEICHPVCCSKKFCDKVAGCGFLFLQGINAISCSCYNYNTSQPACLRVMNLIIDRSMAH